MNIIASMEGLDNRSTFFENLNLECKSCQLIGFQQYQNQFQYEHAT